MDTTLRPLDVHCAGSICPLKLLVLFLVLSPSHMLWDVISEAGACIPSVCLKYLVICLANALLATGWLLASVFSILGELLAEALGVPPTMPKFPPPPLRQDSLPKSKREVGVRPHTQQPVVQHAITPDSDLPQRVSPAAAQPKVGTQPSSSPPRVTDHGISDRAHNSSASSERPLPLAPSTSDGGHDPQSSTEPARGRKLGFLRRHLSSSRGSPKQPSNERLYSRELVASPEQSLERPERAPSMVKPRMKKCRSVEAVGTKKPVPRTDPYQAPYFFPTPLSPDAYDYMSRVRSERVASPLADVRSRVNVPASPVILRTPTSLPPQSPPEAQPDAALSQPPTFRRKSARRSWHISFRHDHQEPLERPKSWTSDSTTVVSAGSHPGDASDADHRSSPETGPRSPRRKRSPGRVLVTPELKPLHEINTTFATPSPTKHTRKSWNLPFMHRRSNSEISTDSQAPSRHVVAESSTPMARPPLRRTT